MILFEKFEVRQKYSAARRIFNSLLGVSSGDETLHLMFDILHETLHLMVDILRKKNYIRKFNLHWLSFVLPSIPLWRSTHSTHCDSI